MTVIYAPKTKKEERAIIRMHHSLQRRWRETRANPDFTDRRKERLWRFFRIANRIVCSEGPDALKARIGGDLYDRLLKKR